MNMIVEIQDEYRNALRYGTLIFRLDNEQTNSRLDILEYEGTIHYYHLFNGNITDVDIVGVTSVVGHVVKFDKDGNFGRGYVPQKLPKP